MSAMKNVLFASLLFLTFSLPVAVNAGDRPGHGPASGKDSPAASPVEQAPAYPAMPGPGKKIQLANGYYFIYGFDKKPKLGTVIIKVEIYSPQGKKDTALEAMADAGMPSMRGAHETGDRPFKLSKKGDYLLPIDIVMPGDWEIRLTLLKDRKVIFRGSYRFDV